ncbi:hypothetical protein COW97_02235 [Candidatus Roizmanbacteria bacterium CG22_combo_CG10-13_8_21_14_all_34_12]|uniref:PsbP C-terminal domain-containing protein n=1 Tax=Candidatus Roizmanbacteria bacterium CG22_combo_CG10-13_8_21_14_all_34_12 TaxID=1974860 RepID=A0A2H0C2B0_9BACT|nr:MAG: hypothetical protein COW97_02235 [Candidatus Roizmanbacteria bacterium CG22_combo_CG10-13_8_21_14_all_34_12]
MKKLLIPIIMGFIFAFLVLIFLRFFVGGDEDNWICVNNQWVKHGNPRNPKPQSGCGIVKNDWQPQTFNEANLSFKIPSGTTFRKEIADDAGKIRVASFYVEKKVNSNFTYTLYGVYQPNKEATDEDLKLAKKEMNPETIKDVTISGYKGIEGLILGPKTRYITILLKNNRLFTVSTIPPTQENKILTDQILATFNFK